MFLEDNQNIIPAICNVLNIKMAKTISTKCSNDFCIKILIYNFHTNSKMPSLLQKNMKYFKQKTLAWNQSDTVTKYCTCCISWQHSQSMMQHQIRWSPLLLQLFNNEYTICGGSTLHPNFVWVPDYGGSPPVQLYVANRSRKWLALQVYNEYVCITNVFNLCQCEKTQLCMLFDQYSSSSNISIGDRWGIRCTHLWSMLDTIHIVCLLSRLHKQ